MADYDCLPLADGLLDKAFPIARLLEPSLGLAEWRRRHRISRQAFCSCAGRGPMTLSTLVVVDSRGYVAALADYAIAPCDRGGPGCFVDRAVAVHLIDPLRPAAALFDGLSRIAREAGCDSVRTRIGGGKSWLVSRLDDAADGRAEVHFLRAIGSAIARRD